MEEKPLKIIVSELLEKKGQVKGDKLVAQFDYIKEKEGEGGVELVEEKLALFNHVINSRDIDLNSWYPIGLIPSIATILRAELYWEDSDIINLGRAVSKPTIVEEVFMVRYFSKLEKSFNDLPNIWNESFSVGTVELGDFSKQDKEGFVRFSNLDIHPDFCRFVEGFILGVLAHGFNSSLLVEETRCSYKGAAFDEFKINW